jgi:hypothetical protein
MKIRMTTSSLVVKGNDGQSPGGFRFAQAARIAGQSHRPIRYAMPARVSA